MIFYALGGLVTFIGAAWSALVIFTTAQNATGPAVVAAVVVAMPGLGTMLSGLLLLAIGSALAKLDQIIANTSHAPPPRRPIDTSRWSRADRERYEAREPEMR